MVLLPATRLASVLLLTVALLTTASQALADEVAAIPNSADERARASFDEFARYVPVQHFAQRPFADAVADQTMPRNPPSKFEFIELAQRPMVR